MGEMADYYSETDYDPRSDPKMWVANDGRCIPVEKMEDTHLLNSIRFLERLKARKERHMLVRGDMGFDKFADSDVEEIYPVYGTMCVEASKRGLNQHLWCRHCQQFHDKAEGSSRGGDPRFGDPLPHSCKTIFCKACKKDHPPAVNRFHKKALGCKSWLQNFVPIVGVKA